MFGNWKKIITASVFANVFLNPFNYSNGLFSQEVKNENISNEKKLPSKSVTVDYLLGPGDILYISFFENQFFEITEPFFNGSYTISPEGKINLPEIGLVNFSGKTIREVEEELNLKYRDILFENNIKITIIDYREVSVHVRGEVLRPGLYSFKEPAKSKNKLVDQNNINSNQVKLFDLIKTAKGVTNYADLSKIVVYRNNSMSQGGGRIKTTVNLLALLENGDQSQNIRLMDGDSIFVTRGERMIKEQILSINKSNLSEDKMVVFITGNVVAPGQFNLRQGSSLNQAIASSGGKKIWTGRVEFVRFNDDGTTTKSSFPYDASAPINTSKNPILMSGDVINVETSLVGKTNVIIREIASPILSSYGLYKIFSK